MSCVRQTMGISSSNLLVQYRVFDASVTVPPVLRAMRDKFHTGDDVGELARAEG